MTAHTVLERTAPAFAWVDVVGPTREELKELARRYDLPPTAVEDCLDPEHLPKYERFGDVCFVIVRAADPAAPPDAGTIQELTRKIAVFAGPGFLLTVHRTPQPFLSVLIEEYRATAGRVAPGAEPAYARILIALINAVVDTYEAPLSASEQAIDGFEATLFGHHEMAGWLRTVFVVKRRLGLIKRLLVHTLDLVQRLTPAADPSAPLYQDLRENAESMHFYAGELLDDLNNLLSIQLAAASHRTSEVMRVLTIFSVFFLPLTFIVGIYGMNFEHMPELRQWWGYPAVVALMAGVAAAIFYWFRRRGWIGKPPRR